MTARVPIKRHRSYRVYMLRCADGTYYAGYTHDLERRLKLHNSGNGAKSLLWKGKLPVELVYAKPYRYYKRALLAEQWLKRRSRSEKEALIRDQEQMRSQTARLGPMISPPSAPKSRLGPIHTSAGA